jgi:raffinose/stachyose/melibiose transport system substrate-binding protein
MLHRTGESEDRSGRLLKTHQEENTMFRIRSRSHPSLVRLVALLTVWALLLAACGGDGDTTTTAASGETTTTATATTAGGGDETTTTTAPEGDPLAGTSINFVTPTIEAGENYYQSAVDAYLAEFPERNIDLESVPNDQVGQVLRTRFIGGNPPALMYVTSGYGNPHAVLPFAEAGYLEPLSGTTAEALVPATSLPIVSLDGVVYGMPLDLTLVATVSNQTAMEADGIAIPATYDELLGLCSTVAANGKSMYVVAGSAPPNTGLFGMSLALSRVYAGDPEWNVKRAAGEVTFSDSPGWQATLQAVVDMNDAGCFQEGVVAAGFAEITNGIATGASYSSFIPAGAAFGLVAEAPDSFFVVDPFPGVTTETTYVAASTNNLLAVAADVNDEEKAAALAFLEWLADSAHPERLADMQAVAGWIALDPDPAALPPQYAPIAPYLAGGQFVPLPNIGWENPEVYNVFGVGIQGILSGQATPEQVLQDMDDAWDS